jgi:hypothetical protein
MAKYFVTKSGLRIDILQVKKVNEDTVFVKARNGVSFILIDSIAEYHRHTAPDKVFGSILFGSTIGLCTGIIFGSKMIVDNGNSNYSYQNNYYQSANQGGTRKLLGGLIGLTLGGLIGALLGSNGVEHIDKDFSKMDRPEKLQQLSRLCN